MVLSAGVIAVSFLAILPHYRDLLQVGFQDSQVASEELLKVRHLVKDHPCGVGGADIFWHRVFDFCSSAGSVSDGWRMGSDNKLVGREDVRDYQERLPKSKKWIYQKRGFQLKSRNEKSVETGSATPL